MTYDNYMSGMEGMNGFRDNNEDLSDILDANAFYFGATTTNPGKLFSIGSGLTPNGLNIDMGMMGGPHSQDNMFQQGPANELPQYRNQNTSFPFPNQQVDLATPMKPQSFSGGEGSECSPASTASHEQAESNGYSHGSEASYAHSEQSPVAPPKPKRTRRSKKKPLTKEQQEIKREEFLERNRVAASKCRKRKQEHNSHLHEHAQYLSRENQQLQQDLAWLQNEMAALSQMILLHKDCKAAKLDNQISQMMEAGLDPDNALPGPNMSRQGSSNSYYGAHGLPTTWVERPGSATTTGFQSPFNPDGSLNLLSPFLTNEQLRAERKKQDAKSEAYMKSDAYQRELAMSRQNSNASRMSGTSESESERPGSGYDSAITTPENTTSKDTPPSPRCVPAPGQSVRRGYPCKTLGNQRSVAAQQQQPGFSINPSQAPEGLRGLQDVGEYLAQRQ